MLRSLFARRQDEPAPPPPPPPLFPITARSGSAAPELPLCQQITADHRCRMVPLPAPQSTSASCEPHMVPPPSLLASSRTTARGAGVCRVCWGRLPQRGLLPAPLVASKRLLRWPELRRGSVVLGCFSFQLFDGGRFIFLIFSFSASFPLHTSTPPGPRMCDSEIASLSEQQQWRR